MPVKNKVRLCDSFLDSTIIKLHHACEDHDNAHPRSFTRTTLFPDGNYGPLINMNMYKEPEKVLEIAQKIETFGATHELFPMAATLKSVVENSEEAITDEAAAIKAEGMAKANTEIAKLKLIRVYNGNYYKAADVGKGVCRTVIPGFRRAVTQKKNQKLNLRKPNRFLP